MSGKRRSRGSLLWCCELKAGIQLVKSINQMTAVASEQSQKILSSKLNVFRIESRTTIISGGAGEEGRSKERMDGESERIHDLVKGC